MTVTVDNANSAWAQFRIVTADTYGADGAGPWTVQTMASASTNGLHFVSCSRQVLPAVGEAVFAMEYGQINGATVAPLDLLGKHVRIQASRDGSTWRTIWVGRVAFQDDQASPGATSPRGTRVYQCDDMLHAYLAQYPLDRHASYVLASALGVGHPGYNTAQIRPGSRGGNREGTGSGFSGPDSTTILHFAVDDAGVTTATTWTDAQALDNCMLIKRNAGDPRFIVDCSPAELLSESTPWPVDVGESAWSLVNRICSRKRGRGLAFLDWPDDSGGAPGALQLYLRVRPQIAASITYTTPTGSSVTITGASGTTGATIAVDLQGDHRVDSAGFQVRTYSDQTIDELTTQGERIVVAATLSGYDNTLAERWTAGQESGWGGDKLNPIYANVLRKFGLYRTASYTYGNGNGGGAQRGDYWTNTAGQVSITHTPITAPPMVRIMDTLPFYEGYTYASGAGVPASSAAADGQPRLIAPRVWIRTHTDRYIDLDDYNRDGHEIAVDDDGISIKFNADEKFGTRIIKGTWNGVAARTISESSLTCTLGLEMPQRPRIVSAIAGTVRRRRTITVQGAHLWIAHPGCMWDLDRSTRNADGSNAIRPFSAGTGALLRDDRDVIARLHFLTWEWYRSDSGRSAVTYAIRDCGLLPTWTDATPAAIDYAKIGQVITTLTANGTTYTPGTPVTRIDYDNRTGTTTWHTDWQELDNA